MEVMIKMRTKQRCKTCGKLYWTYRDKKHTKFCSHKCSIKKVKRICKNCNKNFLVYLCKKSSNFCSRQCFYAWIKAGHRKGKNSNAWKGGIYKRNGYIFIYKPNHPHNNKKYVAEHRLRMELKIGRYLFPYEIVHHINGKKDDNRIENLQLLPEAGQHNKRVQKVYQENKKNEKKIRNLISGFKNETKKTLKMLNYIESHLEKGESCIQKIDAFLNE